jgi:hypothetical protein
MLDYGEYSTVLDYCAQDGESPLSYEHLEGDWGIFYRVARYFVHKVKFEDREDFLHDLMLEMAKVKAKYEAKGKPLTEAGLMRVASYEVTEYWHTLMRHRPTILSLNDKADNGNGNGDGDGEASEVIDFLADDNTVDLDLMLDARRFLLGCPRRLVQIAYKRYSGIPLDTKEQESLRRHRQKELQRYQKTLF